jgi:hypothetical protein
VKTNNIIEKEESDNIVKEEDLSEEEILYEEECGEDEIKDPVQNIFEEKDEYYNENLSFQDARTKTMTETEYIEYISCRTTSFLSRGRKLFSNYLAGNLSPLL